MRYLLGRLFQFLHLPGFVQPFRYYDGETGQVIQVRTSPRYTVLTVGEKDFYFFRESGKPDGIGEMSPDEPSSSDCTAACNVRSTDVPLNAERLH